ncbi:MAG: tetratricopeptide repeat protein [bacterium]
MILILSIWYFNAPASGIKEKLGLGFNINSQKLYGDTRNGKFVYGVNPVQFRYNFKPYAFLESEVRIGQLSNKWTRVNHNTDMINFGMKAGYRFWHQKKINPLVYLGLGVFNFNLGTGSRFWDGYGAVGVGTEFFLSDRLGLNFTGDYQYTTGDDFDRANTGNHRDSFLNLGIGLFYYLGRRSSYNPEPVLTETVSEDLSPYEEVVDKNLDLTEVLHTNNNTPSADLDLLASQKEELLKTKKEKDDNIKLLKIKLASWDEQVKMLEEELEIRKLNASDISSVPITTENDYYIKRYRIGLSFFETENYQAAIKTFNSLLNENPNNVLATNCWYWLGESYFAVQYYNAAIEAFQLVVNDLTSPKNEISQFMLGLCHWQKGETLQAKSEFEKILDNYPNSLYASLIQEYLAEL